MKRVVASGVVGLARVLAGGNVRRIGFTPDERQRIYFANHTSHLDFVIVWSALPKRLRVLTRPVAARDYWANGVRRYLALNVFNAVLVD
ncbi:MAG TPA: 1-acyl-sn-glycerol-3-phosphate acyltransferase, partial [Thermoanaerobaculia bacterium]|nr:1-acyl-sn-glycerol-3-phosphate acyltransferase [Thermoanaerobaculia bacterium]